MRKRFVLLLLLGLMSFLAVCHAQNAIVTYSYDACGNRVERTLKFKTIRNNERSEACDEEEGWLTMAEDSLKQINALYAKKYYFCRNKNSITTKTKQS